MSRTDDGTQVRDYWGNITSQGKKWRLRYTDNARNRQSGGTFSTHEQAWWELVRLAALFREGKLIPEAIEALQGSAGTAEGSLGRPESVLEFFTQMRPKRERVLARSTFTNERSMVDKHILPRLGKYKLGELSEDIVAEFWADLGTHIGASARRNVFCVYSAHMKLAVADGVLPVAPKAPKGWWVMEPQGRDRRSVEDVAELIAALPADLRVMMQLAADVHLRPGEARGLNRGDYNPKTGRLHIQRKDIYTGGRRQHEAPKRRSRGKVGVSLPMRWKLEAHLAALPKGGPEKPMFPGVRGERVSIWWVRKGWNAARTAVGDETWHVHDLRGFGITRLDEQGVSAKDILRRSRHSSPASLLPYLLGDERRDDEVTLRNDWLTEAGMENEAEAGDEDSAA